MAVPLMQNPERKSMHICYLAEIHYPAGVVDPVTTQQMVWIIMGMGYKMIFTHLSSVGYPWNKGSGP